MYSTNGGNVNRRYLSSRRCEYEDLPRYTEYDPDEYDKKRRLMHECQMLVGNCKCDKEALNIAIIGPPGCGKSAFLNTIFASFSTSNWLEYAKSGVFETDEQFSVRLKRYKKKDYYQVNDNIRMPTFVDMTGFDDCDTEHTKELLRVILLGKMKDNEHLGNLKKQSLHQLRKRTRECQMSKSLRINRIIAVCSYDPDSNLPRSLFAAINQIAKERDIPVYGVLTQADKFTSEKDEKAQEKEIAFLKCLGLERHRFSRIVNYCPEVDPEMRYRDSVNPSLDIPVLTFLKQVFTPDLSDSSEPPALETDVTECSLIKRFLVAISIIILAYLFYLFMYLIQGNRQYRY